MPYRVKIAEIEVLIATTLESIVLQRAHIAKLSKRNASKPEAEKKLVGLLATLAKFRAERVRLMDRQGPIPN